MLEAVSGHKTRSGRIVLEVIQVVSSLNLSTNSMSKNPMSDSRRIQVIKSFRRTQNAFTIARTDRRINAQTKKQTFVMEQYREQKQSEQLQTLHFLNVFFWIWRLHFVQVIQGFFAPTFWHDFFLKLHCFYIVLMFFLGVPAALHWQNKFWNVFHTRLSSTKFGSLPHCISRYACPLVIYPGSSLLVFCLTQQHFVIEIVNFRHSESDSIWQHLFDSFPGLMSSACLGMLGIATNAKNVVSKTWRKLSPPPHFARNF